MDITAEEEETEGSKRHRKHTQNSAEQRGTQKENQKDTVYCSAIYYSLQCRNLGKSDVKESLESVQRNAGKLTVSAHREELLFITKTPPINVIVEERCSAK